MTDPKALDLLIDCLRTEVANLPQQVEDATSEASNDALSIAVHTKISSLISKRLVAGPAILAELQRKAIMMATNSDLLLEASAISLQISEDKIPHVIIKGPIQQQQIYGSNFVRPATDIDILVKSPDLVACREILISAGFRLATPSIWWRNFLGEEHLLKDNPRRVAIDLHHRVHQPGTPGMIGAESLVDEAIQVTLNGVQIPALSIENAQLLCTISIAKALYNREPSAAYICDLFVSLMAGAPGTVNSFLTTARRRGLGGHATVALRLTREVFGPDFGLNLDLENVLPSFSGRELLNFIFTPEETTLPFPKRRLLMWEYCERNSARYFRELTRVAASEGARRLFEDKRPH